MEDEQEATHEDLKDVAMNEAGLPEDEAEAMADDFINGFL